MASKKKWYEVEAPKMFENKVIAETPASDSKHLIGRTIEVNLIDLVKDTNKFYMKIYFKIIEVDSKCRNEFVGHAYFRDRIYRMVQKGVKKVNSIDDVVTKDSKKIRIKSMAVVGMTVPTSIKNKIRLEISKTMKDVAKKYALDEILQMIINNELERLARDKCSKIYPTAKVEVYKSEVQK